ncbi:hypothetical protein HYH02_007547 [Chlamydomonas schloesseri]|uniref:Uncharacterized protein n=1 Tax=Chlamydomonas schloesseri TaxID=2026947 RepID=A0A835WHC8_9CHLO|nr:hypothetical protein HYH02_007547 [Chlamydomonas schloesseri]|eukprot:KAG2447629.1 hypothetical protein HYH02_007547 [Chlamydomonas schloesseri]
MLTRLAGVLGRPAALDATAAAVVAAVEPALLMSSAGAAWRDGGRDASTSYGAQPVSPTWGAHQRRGLGALAASSSPGTTAAQPTHGAALHTGRSFSTSTTTAASAAAAAATAPEAAAPPAAPSGGDPAELEEAALAGLDMQALMRAIVHPLPLGRVRNGALLAQALGTGAPVVQLEGGPGGRDAALFFDPAATLSSTMRALHVIRQVLEKDGHVVVVNSNPRMRPLLREAAHLCLNSNVWFWADDWVPGCLAETDARGGHCPLLSDKAQPNRQVMAEQGLVLRNPLVPDRGNPATALAGPPPRLAAPDMERLLAGAKNPNGLTNSVYMRERVASRRGCRQALAALTAARTAEARLVLPGSQTGAGRGRFRQPALVVVLDLSYGGEAVREAAARNVPTVALLNGHSDAAAVTFPVYASESHLGYHHFFLEWLLRVVNIDPRVLSSLRNAAKATAAAGSAGAQAAAPGPGAGAGAGAGAGKAGTGAGGKGASGKR